MFKFQLSTKADLVEAAKLESKRRYEEARKARIFNPKTIRFGADKESLDKQMEEKQDTKAKEFELEKRALKEERNLNNFLNELARKNELERFHIAQQINDYRSKYQKKEDAREFDITDPDLLKKTLRFRDDDPRLGISSAQKFQGEDPNTDARKKTQQDQQRSWLQQQMRERQQAIKDRTQAELAMQTTLEQRDRQAIEIDQAEKQIRRQLQAATAQFNLDLAAAQECKRLRQKQNEEEDNMAEIYNNLTSDMLTENKDCANSNFGLKRKVASNYRGMTNEEKIQFFEDQKEQIKDKKKQVEQAEYVDAQWQQMANNLARMITLQELDMKRRNNNQLALDKEENRRLSEEQRNRRDYMNNVVFKNEASPEFFNQFNTTSR